LEILLESEIFVGEKHPRGRQCNVYIKVEVKDVEVVEEVGEPRGVEDKIACVFIRGRGMCVA
jgi:hypothetical protein